jgi:transcriptional regulator with GAF, ATPase, and Fis domain
MTKIGALIVTDPERAKAEIIEVLRNAKGDRDKAAQALGLNTPRSLYRWIERLEMWAAVDKLAKEEKFVQRSGPLRSRDRIVAAMVRAKGQDAEAAAELRMAPESLRERIDQLGIGPEVARLARA